MSVYNFVVEDWHTYFVTEGKICVHNSVRHILKKAKDKIADAYTKVKDKFKKKPVGDPVDVVTGTVFNENIDFELPGIIPIAWERRYYSDNTRSSILGYGTCLNYETKIIVSEKEKAIALLLPDGRAVEFGLNFTNGSQYNRTEKLTLSEENGIYKVYNHKESLYYFYERKGNISGILYLTEIRDFAGHQIELVYNNGNLTKLVDSVGRILMVRNDNHGRIVEVTLGSKTLVSYGYSIQGDLIRIEDALGQKKTIEYKNHLMIKATTKDGYVIHWEYEENGSDTRCSHSWGENRTLEYYFEYMDGVSYNTNALGYREAVFFNDSNLVAKIIDAEGNTKEYEYNEYEEMVSAKDAMGYKTIFVYDEKGNIAEIIKPSGAKTKYNYDDIGRTTKVSYPNGGELIWKYNREGNIDKCIEPDGAETKYYYNKKNLVSEIEDALGNKKRFCYDNWGNLNEIHYPDGSKEVFEHDEYGNCIKAINLLGAEQLMTYDKLNRVTRIDGLDGNIIYMKYNGHNEVVTVKDKQRTIDFEYTLFGKLKKRKELDRTLKFIYDEEEQLKSIINENRDTYTFEYDGNGNVIEEISFDGLRFGYVYNKAGWLDNVQQPDGKEKSFKYDKDGKLIQIQYADGSVEKYKYNQMGSLVEAVNSDSNIKIERDITGRVIRTIQDNYIIENEYNKLGQRIETKSSLGACINLEYNKVGGVNRLCVLYGSGIKWDSEFKYNELGQEVSRNIQGELSSIWEYDKVGRPTTHVIKGFTDRKNTKTYIWGINYELKSIINNGGEIKYTYDEYGDLSCSSFNAEAIFRSFDKVGNVYETKEHCDRQYGKDGRLLKSTKAIYEYDELGNLRKKMTKEGTWEYLYYANNLMSSVIRPDGKKVTFKYDGFGRRIEKNFDGKKIRFLWDENILLHEWEEKNELSENSILWVFDTDGYTLLAKVTEDESFSIITDHLGTPIEMYHSLGNKIWENNLDIYGKTDYQDKTDYKNCPFRYPGQYEDEETELYYNRFRYYSPVDGLYTQQDPIRLNGGNPSLYGYVYNTLTSIDIYGLIPIYRAMKAVNGKPSHVESTSGLGARIGKDIQINTGGNAVPGKGISVAPSPKDLPEFARPVELGGSNKKTPIWVMESDDLGPNLKYDPDSKTHGTIQPAKSMSVEEYQNELKNTDSKWTKVDTSVY